MSDLTLSLTLDGTPDLPGGVLQALYRITGRSTVALRRSIRAGEPAFTAPLFGTEHLDAVPRLEKTIAYLHEIGVPFTLGEETDGERTPITAATMREILEGAAPAEAD